ncbi:unnamed protein product, partial [Prorocentrum cordatum]
QFVDRQSVVAKTAGCETHFEPAAHPVVVNGVGKGGQQAAHQAVVPIQLNEEPAEFRAPCLMGDGAGVPALRGLRSQRQSRAIIDTGGNAVLIPGPGGFSMTLSPGSKVIRCENAISGHMMIPVSDFEEQDKEMIKSSTKWVLYGACCQLDSSGAAYHYEHYRYTVNLEDDSRRRRLFETVFGSYLLYCTVERFYCSYERFAARPPGAGDHNLYHVREIFSGSCKFTEKNKAAGMHTRSPVDLTTKWNLLWRTHQLELLRQVREEPAQAMWLDPPGAATGTGSAKDHELARYVTELVRTQLDSGLHVVIVTTASSHFWKHAELQPLLTYERLKHWKYSWCGLGAVDPLTGRPWHRLRRVLSTIDLPHLCLGWPVGSYRAQCCQLAHLHQATRKRFQSSNALDRNKASREYPERVIMAARLDLMKFLQLRSEESEKYNQSVVTKTKKRAKPTLVLPDECSGDCGDDFTPLLMKDKHGEFSQERHAERVAAVASFTVMRATQADEIYYIDDEIDDPAGTKCYHEDSLRDFEHYLVETTIATMEIYGGEAGTTRSSARLGLRGGQKEDVRQLWYYIIKCRPRVIVMAPPCTAFSPWSQVRRHRPRSQNTWHRNRAIGEKLARLAAQVAEHRASQGSLFIVKNSYASEMWKLPYWEALLGRDDVHSIKIQMCADGLSDPFDEHRVRLIRKDTLIDANRPEIIRPLRILRCPGASPQHVHQINENGRSPYTQVWPKRLCQLLARGIKCAFDMQPVEAHPTAEELAVAGCLAYRRRQRKDDPTHTRVVGECLYPDIPAAAARSVWNRRFTCPSCKVKANRWGPRHTFKGNECRWSSKQIEEREKAAPRVPAGDVTEPKSSERAEPPPR